jgi:hypothetical protein
MDEQSTRKAALLKPGTLSPNPWDLTPSGQNGWRYNEGTRTEDKAPQGCDLSAASSAGMAGAAAMLRPPQNIQIQTRQRLTYCRPNLVLTMGSTLENSARTDHESAINGRTFGELTSGKGVNCGFSGSSLLCDCSHERTTKRQSQNYVSSISHRFPP